ncbi:MAG: phosphoribosylformylglycinamidine cyclo-ligase [Planctomycetota bacterium]
MTEQESAYKAAGVDIDAKYRAVRGGQRAIRSTFTAGVVSDVGQFGGIFDPAAAGVAGQLLVASTDGVGTKVMLARQAGRLAGVGADLVQHCVNDILVQGARPLFFLDYIAVAKMVEEEVQELIEGLAEACRANDCALLGGETAEMPGVYRDNELDVAGTIVGAVARERVLDGSQIRAGDAVIALPSSGLHTNGYSLARRIVSTLGVGLEERPEALHGASLADALLAVHRSYYRAVWPLLERGVLTGMAHITGGGLFDNIPRVVPTGLTVEVRTAAVPRPPIFDYLVEHGDVRGDEAYRVFNMGFGMVLFAPAAAATAVLEDLQQRGEAAYLAGEVLAGDDGVRLV